MDKILVFLADGFEEVEALTVIDYLRRAGIGVDTVTINDSLDVRAAHDVIIKADKLLGDINEDEYRGLYVPGGTKGAENLRDDERVIEIVKSFYDDGKTVAAICAGPIVLDKAGVLADKKCVSSRQSRQKSIIAELISMMNWS